MQPSRSFLPAFLAATVGAFACGYAPTAPRTAVPAADGVSDLAQPGNTTIILNVAETETWTATGVFEDAGSVFFAKLFFTGIPSPVAGVAHITTIQTSERGSFAMYFQRVIPDGPIPWVLKDGTGAYATLQGTGTCTRAPGPDGVIVTCTGDVHSP
jgi:hypothetical protein